MSLLSVRYYFLVPIAISFLYYIGNKNYIFIITTLLVLNKIIASRSSRKSKLSKVKAFSKYQPTESIYGNLSIDQFSELKIFIFIFYIKI